MLPNAWIDICSYLAQHKLMTMKPNYKPPFSRFVKKAHKPLQLAIEDAVEEVCENPVTRISMTNSSAI